MKRLYFVLFSDGVYFLYRLCIMDLLHAGLDFVFCVSVSAEFCCSQPAGSSWSLDMLA